MNLMKLLLIVGIKKDFNENFGMHEREKLIHIFYDWQTHIVEMMENGMIKIET